MKEITAKVERTIHAPVSKVWAALTDKAKLKKFFFGAEVDTDWKVGSPIHMRGEFKGKPYEDKGSILIDEPEHVLSFSHFSPLTGAADLPENYHVVTFTLDPEGDGDTHVELSQANLTGGIRDSDQKQKGEYEKNWSKLLQGLEDVVTHEISAV